MPECERDASFERDVISRLDAIERQLMQADTGIFVRIARIELMLRLLAWISGTLATSVVGVVVHAVVRGTP